MKAIIPGLALFGAAALGLVRHGFERFVRVH